MKIAVIGSGQIGFTFAQRLVALGNEVVVSRARPVDQDFENRARSIGAQVAAVSQAPSGAGLVIMAVPFGRFRELDPAPFAGHIVMDTMNHDPYRDPPEPRFESGELTTAELLAEHLPGTRVVKAFNTMWFQRILAAGRVDEPLQDRLGVPVAADDPVAKQLVWDLCLELGFAPVDGGLLADSFRQEYGTPVFNQPVGPAKVAELLAKVA